MDSMIWVFDSGSDGGFLGLGDLKHGSFVSRENGGMEFARAASAAFGKLSRLWILLSKVSTFWINQRKGFD